MREKRKPPAAGKAIRSTCSLQDDAPNFLTLLPDGGEPISYRLQGWIELSVSKADVSVELVNVTGSRIGTCAEGIPKTIHGSMPKGAEPRGTLDPKTGCG